MHCRLAKTRHWVVTESDDLPNKRQPIIMLENVNSSTRHHLFMAENSEKVNA